MIRYLTCLFLLAIVCGSQTLISLAMQGLILSSMISLPNGLGAEDVLPKHGKRLFFSTIFSEDLKVFCTEEEHSSSDQTDHDPVNYIRCYYMPFDGRSKSATMNRKRSVFLRLYGTESARE